MLGTARLVTNLNINSADLSLPEGGISGDSDSQILHFGEAAEIARKLSSKFFL